MSDTVTTNGEECRFFGSLVGTRQPNGKVPVQVFSCRHPARNETTLENCAQCRFFQRRWIPLVKRSLDDPAIASSPPTPEVLPVIDQHSNAHHIMMDRYLNPLSLENFYYERGVFLILSGPSLSTLNLSSLLHPGIMTMGINNSPSLFKPNLWTFVDPSAKFHQGIWFDPTILKFVPMARLKDKLRVKDSTGQFKWLKCRAKDAPGVVSYRRNADFSPRDFLSQPSVNWGNDKESAEKNKYPHVLSVFLAALRIVFHLGFRRVYLLGCDFKMDQESPAYAFPQNKTEGAVRGNNHSYAAITEMCWLLRPVFDRADFLVYNCNPNSELRVFPIVSFEEAVEFESSFVPKIPWDTLGWYEELGDPSKIK